jgi:hypothetical protein
MNLRCPCSKNEGDRRNLVLHKMAPVGHGPGGGVAVAGLKLELVH